VDGLYVSGWGVTAWDAEIEATDELGTAVAAGGDSGTSGEAARADAVCASTTWAVRSRAVSVSSGWWSGVGGTSFGMSALSARAMWSKVEDADEACSSMVAGGICSRSAVVSAECAATRSAVVAASSVGFCFTVERCVVTRIRVTAAGLSLSSMVLAVEASMAAVVAASDGPGTFAVVVEVRDGCCVVTLWVRPEPSRCGCRPTVWMQFRAIPRAVLVSLVASARAGFAVPSPGGCDSFC